MISDMCLTYGDMNRFITSAECLFGIIAEKKYEPKVSAGPLTVVIPLRQFGSLHPLWCYSKITFE